METVSKTVGRSVGNFLASPRSLRVMEAHPGESKDIGVFCGDCDKECDVFLMEGTDL